VGSNTYPTGPGSAFADAAALGLPALAAVLAGAQDGYVVVDADRRFIYANTAACQMLGRPLEQLQGQDYLYSFSPREHARMRATQPARLGENSATFTRVLVAPDGTQREIVSSTYSITIDGSPYGVAVLRDLTDPRAAARNAVALGQTAAQLGETGTTISEILNLFARHAVEGTRALSCGIAVVGEDHKLASAGGYGPPGPGYGIENPALMAMADAPEVFLEAMTAGSIAFADAPGRPVVIPDARALWESNPLTRPLAINHQNMDWRAGVYVPLSSKHKLIGIFVIYLPADVAGPSEVELAFYTALADQASLVMINARLAAQAGPAAALLERGRLARELHDSVSQGLFSMTMHARAAQLSMARTGMDASGPLGRSIHQLAELTAGALAEMRALIFELRPGALAEEGLVGALRKQTAAIASREQLAITVTAPEQRVQLEAGVEQHLYRIVSEALHNVVKHAHADNVTVAITTAAGILEVRISDNGVGYDSTKTHPGHLGMATMAERAEAIGADLSIISSQGTGTVVALSMPFEPTRSV
jgi:PAS domain S-box-containing protein